MLVLNANHRKKHILAKYEKRKSLKNHLFAYIITNVRGKKLYKSIINPLFFIQKNLILGESAKIQRSDFMTKQMLLNPRMITYSEEYLVTKETKS